MSEKKFNDKIFMLHKKTITNPPRKTIFPGMQTGDSFKSISKITVYWKKMQTAFL